MKTPVEQILHDPYYRPPAAREFGVHPNEIRRVVARHSADIDCALGILVRAAERCGFNGEFSKDRTLGDAVLKSITIRLIEIAWGGEGWTAMAAGDALLEIRLALRARFPGAEQDGGLG